MRVGNRKVLQGTVHSNKMAKTIAVDVQRRFKHIKYGKYVVRTKRYYAHDEDNKAQIGDSVTIAETRPLSKMKRWRLLDITRRAQSREGASS